MGGYMNGGGYGYPPPNSGYGYMPDLQGNTAVPQSNAAQNIQANQNAQTVVPNGANTQYTGGLNYGPNPYMYSGQGGYGGYGVMQGYNGYNMPQGGPQGRDFFKQLLSTLQGLNTNTTNQPATPTPPTTPTDPNAALITSAYQKDFGRAPDAAGLAYYQQQLAQHPEYANNLNAIIGGGAAAGSADYNAYNANNLPTEMGGNKGSFGPATSSDALPAVNPVTVGGTTYNPTIPSGVGAGYINNLNAANANPQIASALAGAVNAGIPGFNVVKTGGRIKYKY